MSNILKTILIIATLVIIPRVTFAANLFIDAPQDEYRIGEQFIVSVAIISEEENPINAVDLKFGFSQETLRFVNSTERNSIISMFIDRPALVDGKIVLSGITPGGFYGVIDPIVDSEKLLPVRIIDFIFEPIAPGRAEIYLEEGQIFRSDGSGLPVVFTPWPKVLNIKDEVFESMIDLDDDVPPLPFEVQVIKDAGIKGYLLIFNAEDEGSGIDHYDILEEGRKVVIADSPYVLKNKPPRGLITVRAYDKSGNVQSSSIEAPEFPKEKSINISLIVAIILVLVLIFLYTRKKKKG